MKENVDFKQSQLNYINNQKQQHNNNNNKVIHHNSNSLYFGRRGCQN